MYTVYKCTHTHIYTYLLNVSPLNLKFHEVVNSISFFQHATPSAHQSIYQVVGIQQTLAGCITEYVQGCCQVSCSQSFDALPGLYEIPL